MAMESKFYVSMDFKKRDSFDAGVSFQSRKEALDFVDFFVKHAANGEYPFRIDITEVMFDYNY